jgi:RNA polymerase sigma-70 factor (ECF subfamily)
MTPDSDEALMAMYQQGQAEVLEELVRRYAGALLGYLARLTSDRQHAEDLFQETFMRVHTKAATFKPEQSFKRWLFAIATNLSMDFFRRRGRRPEAAFSDPAESDRLVTSLPDSRPDPSAEAERADARRQVVEALDQLPPRQRSTLVLAYFEGLSYGEVARVMGCSVGTVKTQVSRALQTLIRILPEAAPQGGKGGGS